MAYQFDYAMQQQGSISPSHSPFGQVQMPMGSTDPSKTTLWMGELEPWIDENYVRQIWYNLGEQVNVKMIKDKINGSNAGYCFVDFGNYNSASKALALVNGTPMPNTNRPFKLNWASGGGINDRREDRGPEYSIFVGDLGPEVNEFMLVSIFQGRYPSCKSAKIMTDPVTGLSRGYGFVRFSEEMDQQRALNEMQGVFCGNRPMRISTATPKNKGGPNPMQQMMGAPLAVVPNSAGVVNQFNDPNNTTVFVGGLSGYVTEEELRGFFQGFGEITYVKIPPGKGCGFVQFVHRQSAEMAISQMQGYPIGNSRVRLSWGRSQSDKTTGAGRPQPPLMGGAGMAQFGSYGSPVAGNTMVNMSAPMDQQQSVQMNQVYVPLEGMSDHHDDSRQWRSGVYAQ